MGVAQDAAGVRHLQLRRQQCPGTMHASVPAHGSAHLRCAVGVPTKKTQTAHPRIVGRTAQLAGFALDTDSPAS
eukprot:9018554-Alexandrium_andersonii.AAC.1